MHYFRREDYAISRAKELDAHYGLSVLPAESDRFNQFEAWYVGTPEELVKAGVPKENIKRAMRFTAKQWLKDCLEEHVANRLKMETQARTAYKTGPLRDAVEVLATAHHAAADAYKAALDKLISDEVHVAALVKEVVHGSDSRGQGDNQDV